MDNPIIEKVLTLLREVGLNANPAFPGQSFSGIDAPAAAVHIEQVDRRQQTLTVEAVILCPASMGGTACELEALKATRQLTAAGAECVQSGCSYDSLARVYSVPVKAVFTCSEASGTFPLGPGFEVFLNDTPVPAAVRVTAEQSAGHQMQYSMGQTVPVGISRGPQNWNFLLEELITAGHTETPEIPEPFCLRICRNGRREELGQCRWISQHREWSREGLRLVRKGIAMTRQEEQDG